jgi:hypothetical protein
LLNPIPSTFLLQSHICFVFEELARSPGGLGLGIRKAPRKEGGKWQGECPWPKECLILGGDALKEGRLTSLGLLGCLSVPPSLPPHLVSSYSTGLQKEDQPVCKQSGQEQQ